MQSVDPATVADLRQSCRTVVDALEHLKIPDTGGQVAATIHAGETLCPDGQTVGMVLIGTGTPGDCNRRFVRVADSKTFRGRLTDGTPINGSIHELNGAAVELDGGTVLIDGRRIRGVAFQPGVQFPQDDFTPRQHFIVYLAVKLLGEEDRCYRSVSERLLPDVKWLDYSAIQQIRPRHVERLVDRIKQSFCASISETKTPLSIPVSNRRIEAAKPLSEREIEVTLRLAGFQFPKVQKSRCGTEVKLP